MAVAIQDHMHIDTMTTPVAEYAAIQGTWEHAPTAPLAIDYALNGMVHVHRLLDGDSAIIIYENTTIGLLCTWAEMATLRALASSTVYFTSNYHDDDEDGAGSLKAFPLSEYVVRAAMTITSNQAVDAMCTYWRMTLRLTDMREDPA